MGLYRFLKKYGYPAASGIDAKFKENQKKKIRRGDAAFQSFISDTIIVIQRGCDGYCDNNKIVVVTIVE